MIKRLRQHLRRLVLRELPRRHRFAVIYRLKWWGGRSAESASGLGSSLAATSKIREELPALLVEVDCQRLIDLGCGDFNWMKEVALPCNYLGVDIVSSVIAENQKRYTKPGIEFSELDATSDRIPGDVDVILCREVLFHLSFKDIWSTLANIKNSNAKYLLLTQVDMNKENTDIHTGGFRQLDLTEAPFNFPGPRKSIQDDSISQNRSIGLWKTEDIVLKSV
jgi:2-polyprenyl-3-methyl-5-hydroxy-6-metoxy-1,4-benzoquinol methylase